MVEPLRTTHESFGCCTTFFKSSVKRPVRVAVAMFFSYDECQLLLETPTRPKRFDILLPGGAVIPTAAYIRVVQSVQCERALIGVHSSASACRLRARIHKMHRNDSDHFLLLLFVMVNPFPSLPHRLLPHSYLCLRVVYGRKTSLSNLLKVGIVRQVRLPRAQAHDVSLSNDRQRLSPALEHASKHTQARRHSSPFGFRVWILFQIRFHFRRRFRFRFRIRSWFRFRIHSRLQFRLQFHFRLRFRLRFRTRTRFRFRLRFGFSFFFFSFSVSLVSPMIASALAGTHEGAAYVSARFVSFRFVPIVVSNM